MKPWPLRRASCAPGAGAVVAVAISTLSWGCGGDAVSGVASASGSAAPASDAPPPSSSSSARRRSKMTPPATALSNFEGQLRQSEASLERHPGSVDLRSRVVSSYLTRGQLLGKPSDLARAVELIDAAEKPTKYGEKDLLSLRASTLAGVHRFGEALKVLESAVPADELKQPTTQALQRGSIWAAQGKLDEGLVLIQLVRAARSEIGVLTLEGKVLGDMGRIDEAVAAFDRAEARYRNPAPFALADLHFERGLMWETRGDLTKAKAAYQAAADLLPMHAHAVLHLAQLVTPKEGVDLLVALKRTCEDPEVDARLGELRDLVEKGSGEADLKKAAEGYEAILAKLPEAYADHAAWFYAGPGKDPEKAWKWASKNLENRQTQGAYELGLVAARQAKRPAAEHCDLAKKAKAYAWHSPRLDEELAAFAKTDEGKTCGI